MLLKQNCQLLFAKSTFAKDSDEGAYHSVSKKSFRHAAAQFFELHNLQKTVSIERERGFLPLSLFPRYSIIQAKSTFPDSLINSGKLNKICKIKTNIFTFVTDSRIMLIVIFSISSGTKIIIPLSQVIYRFCRTHIAKGDAFSSRSIATKSPADFLGLSSLLLMMPP